jgi:hypothetical protein
MQTPRTRGRRAEKRTSRAIAQLQDGFLVVLPLGPSTSHLPNKA